MIFAFSLVTTDILPDTLSRVAASISLTLLSGSTDPLANARKDLELPHFPEFSRVFAFALRSFSNPPDKKAEEQEEQWEEQQEAQIDLEVG
jgi:hypothetical protein